MSLSNMYILLLLLFLLSGCDSNEKSSMGKKNVIQKAEYITRKHDEFRFLPPSPDPIATLEYPWHIPSSTEITKYHFRCKGSAFNPMQLVEQQGEKQYIFDCNGSDYHSLPLRNEEEFIYPILIDLLNYLQNRANGKVIITSGHRCPLHNTFVDNSPLNRSSKHQIGAEVDFYITDYEKDPHKVIEWIQDYYKQHPIKSKEKDFVQFQRYEKEDAHVRTKPWYNKEIFIKLYQTNEGRNKDNKHGFPYISVQVRWDETAREKVNYSPDKAFKGYYRY